MSETIGKLVECDRCQKSHFVPSHEVKVMRDGALITINQYDEMPEGWKYHMDVGLLCDDCEKLYEDFLNEFFGM